MLDNFNIKEQEKLTISDKKYVGGSSTSRGTYLVSHMGKQPLFSLETPRIFQDLRIEQKNNPHN